MSTLATRVIFALVMTATIFALAQSANAVQLDAGGQGQVLIYPYYTVNQFPNGQRSQQTLLSIVNTSDAAQVVQVTFREALNGRAALQFKVWMGRWDVWTGTVFALADDGIASDGAGVLTRDATCTTPMFSSGSLTSGGARYFPLGNANYSGALSDGGPSELGRARHGWIEVMSLANVTGPSASAISFLYATGMPANCAAVQNLAYGTDVSTRPSGGLAGSVSIIRVAEGTLLASRAEALSGFTDISLFSDSMHPAPDLASVNEGTPGGAVSAMVVDDQGRNQVLTYGAPRSGSRPVDAVSAALMATRVKNEYQSAASLYGATDLVLTLPTKPFYTDPALIGASTPALPPFDEPFTAPGSSRVCVPYSLFSQDQRQYLPDYDNCSLDPSPPIPPWGGPPRPLIIGLFQASNVVAFLTVTTTPTLTGVLAAPLPPGATNPWLPWFIYPWVAPAGWLDMNLATPLFNHRLPASSEGKVLSGLPVIGYAASIIVNGNVSNGVLANYGYAVRHVTTVACSKASDGLPCD